VGIGRGWAIAVLGDDADTDVVRAVDAGEAPGVEPEEATLVAGSARGALGAGATVSAGPGGAGGAFACGAALAGCAGSAAGVAAAGVAAAATGGVAEAARSVVEARLSLQATAPRRTVTRMRCFMTTHRPARPDRDATTARKSRLNT
jgi:hypothetical protein